MGDVTGVMGSLGLGGSALRVCGCCRVRGCVFDGVLLGQWCGVSIWAVGHVGSCGIACGLSWPMQWNARFRHMACNISQRIIAWYSQLHLIISLSGFCTQMPHAPSP